MLILTSSDFVNSETRVCARLLGKCRERIAAFPPGFEATLERPNALDAAIAKKQRHTGAGGFVGSSTVENDFAVSRQQFALFRQLRGIQMHGARNGLRVGLEIQRVAEVEYGKVFSRVN